MRWMHYSSLSKEAREAIKAGTGHHGRFWVDGRYISEADDSGNPTGWTLVVRSGSGKPIVEVPAHD